jgi:hypothetical protein
MSQAARAHSTIAPAFGRLQSASVNRNLYLEPSPIEADGGENVGKLPSFIEPRDLRALGHPERLIRAIRAKCLDCSGGVPGEARNCVAIGCPLWPFRMGVNPFHGRAAL